MAVWAVGSTQRFVGAGAVTTALVTTIVFWATEHEPRLDVPLEIAGCPPSPMNSSEATGFRWTAGGCRHGRHLSRSLDAAFLRLAQEHDWTYVLAARHGCRLSHLLTSYQGQVKDSYRACYEATPHLIQRVLATWNPTAVIAMDRFEVIDFVGPDGVVAGRTPSISPRQKPPSPTRPGQSRQGGSPGIYRASADAAR